MKIVYIAGSIIPSRSANSIHVMKMCNALAGNGHDVTLLVPARTSASENMPAADIFELYGVNPCFELRRLFWLPMKGQGFVYGLHAARVAHRLNPDLVYTRHVKSGFFAAKMHLPVVLESHTPVRNAGILSNMLFRWLIGLSCFRRLVVITQSLRRYYADRYSQLHRRIIVAPDGADRPKTVSEPLTVELGHARPRVGYVGNLYSGKGMEIITALALECTWADFHIVGGTNGDLRYWRERCNDSRNLFFHGFVSHNEVRSYLASFDILLLPNQRLVQSYRSRVSSGQNIADWTSPLKLFEYMAAGKPIISSDLPVLREVLEHGHNALLCPPEDLSAWAKTLERLRNNSELRRRLAETARADLVGRYTWHARATRILDRVAD